MKKLSPVLKRNTVRIISLAALVLIFGYALLSASEHRHEGNEGIPSWRAR
jgi:hypothetical protein